MEISSVMHIPLSGHIDCRLKCVDVQGPCIHCGHRVVNSPSLSVSICMSPQLQEGQKAPGHTDTRCWHIMKAEILLNIPNTWDGNIHDCGKNGKTESIRDNGWISFYQVDVIRMLISSD